MATEAVPRKSLLKSRAVQMVLGLLVSAGCIWWAGKDLIDDPAARQQFLDAFRTADYRYGPLLIGMLAAFYLLKAYRWKLLLSPLGEFRTVGDCFGPMISGFAVNNVLPARAGELLRTVVFAKQTGRPITSVLTTVALERIFDMLAILVCLAVGLLSVPGMPEWMTKSAMGLGAVVLVAVLGAAVFMIWTPEFVRFANATLRVLYVPETPRHKIQELMQVAATGLDSLKSPRTLALIVIVSLVKWLINGSMMYLSLLSFGVQVPFAAALVLLGVVAIGVAVPAAPGFFGVIQACFVNVLQFFPVPPPAVLAASIYYHMIQYIPVTIVGLLWLNRSGIRLGEVEQVQSPEGEAPAEPHARVQGCLEGAAQQELRPPDHTANPEVQNS